MSWFTGRPPASAHAHGALVLDVEQIHDAAVVVSRHGHAAAQVADDQVRLLIGLAQAAAAFRPMDFWFRAWNWLRRRKGAKPV